jgi:hypothetical protein
LSRPEIGLQFIIRQKYNILRNHSKVNLVVIFFYDNPQYGLSKSQSFVVYSMLKISDVTDSGRQ